MGADHCKSGKLGLVDKKMVKKGKADTRSNRERKKRMRRTNEGKSNEKTKEIRSGRPIYRETFVSDNSTSRFALI